MGVQHFRQKEPPGEGGALHCSPGRSDKGAIPGMRRDSVFLSGGSVGARRRTVSPGQAHVPSPSPPHTSSMPGGPKGSRDGVPVAEIPSHEPPPRW